MSRTVTGLYDTRAEAEAARDRLSSEVGVEGRAQIIDKSSMDAEQGSSGFESVSLSSDDRNVYGEGLRRGGFMLCAEVDEDEEADRIVAILKQTSTVDLDQRQATWRSEGWRPEASDAQNSSMEGSRESVGSEDRGAFGFEKSERAVTDFDETDPNRR